MARSRFEPPARLVDWSILVVVALVGATGLLSLVSGHPSDAIVFVVHSVGGLALVVLLFWKLRRVRPRVTVTRAWDRHTPVSVLLALVALAALATGALWAFGVTPTLGPWPLLFVHMVLGALVLPVLVVHLRSRFRLPTTRDFEGRRTALSYLGVVGFGALTWRLQDVASRVLETGGEDQRFTGSAEDGSGDGNAFPITSWVADDPDPVDPAEWSLRVGGAVERDLALDYADLDPDHERRETIDCTSGWYSAHDWRGVRVADLLDAVDPAGDANWVSFRSVTGYRWSLPIEEAREAVLATHTDGDRLSHGHGFPLRLVAPGRRGFQWVKWVEAVEVTRRRDFSEWLAIFVSGFEE